MTSGRKLANTALHIPLLALQLVDLFQGCLGVALGAFGAGLLELSPGVLQATQGRVGLARPRRSALCGGLSHGFGRLLQLPGSLLEPLIVVLPREPLQLAGGFFRLVRQLPLRLCSAR